MCDDSIPAPAPLCGIYCVHCTVTELRYIGSSKNIKDRWSRHRYTLRRKKHRNPHLQAAWDMYGESAFEFSILEHCLPEVRVVREEVWIKHYRADERNGGFNLRSPEHRVFSPEARARMSLAHKGQVPWNKGVKGIPRDPAAVAITAEKNRGRKRAPFSPESRAKMSAAKAGKPGFFLGKIHSNESRAKMSAARKAYFARLKTGI